MKDVAAQDVVPTATLKISLEPPLLAAAGVIADDALFQKRLVKINTALTFRQQKYNLLREETEGYSRLNVLLCSVLDVPSDAEVAAFITNVFSVVGHFDLEPNRVLDFVLDAFEQQPFNRAFLSLLRRFKRSNIAHLLGFKFMMYSAADTAAAPADKAKDQEASKSGTTADAATAEPADGGAGATAPVSLYVLTAVLIAEGMVAMEELFPYLKPEVEAVGATLARVEKAIRQQITSYGVVSLAGSTTKDSKNADAEGAENTELLYRVLQSSRKQNDAGTFTGTGECTGTAAKVSTELSKSKMSAAATAAGGNRKQPPPPQLLLPPENGSAGSATAADAASRGGKPPPPSYPPPAGKDKSGAGSMDRLAVKVWQC